MKYYIIQITVNYEGHLKEIMELYQLTIHELQEKIKNGDVSATQITESVFSQN